MEKLKYVIFAIYDNPYIYIFEALLLAVVLVSLIILIFKRFGLKKSEFIEKYRWAGGMFISLFGIVLFTLFGGVHNLAELKYRLSLFNSPMPYFGFYFYLAWGGAIVVGLVFWFIKTFGPKKTDSTKTATIRAVVIMLVLFLATYLTIFLINFFDKN